MNETVLDAVAAAIAKALEYDPNTVVKPEALLWPDKAGEWSPIVPYLRDHFRVAELGELIEGKSGPAYWIRCAVARTLPVDGPDGPTIVYLPQVSREDLRAIDGCPPEVAPIAELQYRSQWFTHPNGRDWTVKSLLANSDRGLGLQLADDSESASAVRDAIGELIGIRLSRLKGKYLDAEYFNDLLNPDPIRSLLDWLDEPNAFRGQKTEAQWSAFRKQSQTDFDLDPETDGAIIAAERLGLREDGWDQVWERFREAPADYPKIPERLRQARPLQLPLDERRDAWPQDNEDEERQLRDALSSLADETPDTARKKIVALWDHHQERRGWVWADLGLAPLVFSLEHIKRLAGQSETALPDGGVDELAQFYAEDGWVVDDALCKALAASRAKSDREAVCAAVNPLYRTWAHELASKLQGAVGPDANAGTYEASPRLKRQPGRAFLFVDGLRLDVAQELAERLEGVGLQVGRGIARAPLPTVTPTCKSALAPVPEKSLEAGAQLSARRSAGGAAATIKVLRDLMAEDDVQVLGGADVGDPAGCAWTEAGKIDARGHDFGIALVDYLDSEVQEVALRARELLDSGWKEVEIVTDHGWLLMPRQLEKVDLPAPATAHKKGRCARLKPGAVVDVETVPWYWDQDVSIAVAPGTACFEAGKHYEHGGVSPQECVLPRLVVAQGETKTTVHAAEITGVKWLRLLCRVDFVGIPPGGLVDIRGLPSDSSTSVAEAAKETTGAGRASLIVPDEDQEGEKAFVVVVGGNGELLAQRQVIIGQNR